MWSGFAEVLAEMFDRGQDLYAILGVSSNADMAAIKKAYRQRALECHPDRCPGDPTCEERFKQVAAAYEVLSNPSTRASYDMQRGFSAQGQPGWKWPPSRSRQRQGWAWDEPQAHEDPSGPAYDFSRTANVGPYMGVSFDQVTSKATKKRGRRRNFRVVVYSAYNAFGLIGSEENGVAIFDEDNRRVLADGILPQASGSFGPSDEQRAFANRLIQMSAAEFRSFVNQFPRSRYTLDAYLDVERER